MYFQVEYIDDAFCGGDDDDDDYVPPIDKVKKLKRRKLPESKLSKTQNHGTTKVIRRIKVLRTIKDEDTDSNLLRRRADGKKPTTITCCKCLVTSFFAWIDNNHYNWVFTFGKPML